MCENGYYQRVGDKRDRDNMRAEADKAANNPKKKTPNKARLYWLQNVK